MVDHEDGGPFDQAAERSLGRRGMLTQWPFVVGGVAAAATMLQRPAEAHAEPPPGRGDPLPRTLDVTDYGAVGDGVTNDAPAIQQAIDAVSDAGPGEANGGGVVFIPRGVYALGSALSVTSSGVVIRGEGQGSRLVRQSGNAAPYVVGFIGDEDLKGAKGSLRNVGLQDLMIGEVPDSSFTAQQQGQDGVRFERVVQFRMSDVDVLQNNGAAVRIIDSFVGQIMGGALRFSMDGIIFEGVTNALRIGMCRIQANRGSGIKLSPHSTGRFGASRSQGIHIFGNDIEGNGGNGILMTDGLYRGISIVGNYFEYNLHDAPRFADPRPHGSDEPTHIYKTVGGRDTTGVTVTGNLFNPNGSTNLAVAFLAGKDGYVAGNGYRQTATNPESPLVELGSETSNWFVHGDGAAATYRGDTVFPGHESGVVLTSPSGSRFRVSVADDGTLTSEAA